MTHSLKKSSLVPWKDLVNLTRREALIENTITLPWLGASWIFAAQGWWLLALASAHLSFDGDGHRRIALGFLRRVDGASSSGRT